MASPLPDLDVDQPAVARLLTVCSFPASGAPLTCAVSGGADSLALLVLARGAGCRVTAVHVDHGLRPGSEREAEVVAAAAGRLSAAFRAEKVHVEAGPNLEARARAARAGVLPPDAATGHTADDQAETVLLNLLRGAGLTGLAGMKPGPRHPILRLRRRETEDLCRTVGLTPVRDPSNVDPAHLRNRIRHEVLPLLSGLAGRDVGALVARQARLLGDDAAFLDRLARCLDPTDAPALAGAPLPLARRSIRGWLQSEGKAGPHPPDAATVERVLAVARGESRACEVGGGVRVRRSRGRLLLERPK